jgi:hypothetical protein
VISALAIERDGHVRSVAPDEIPHAVASGGSAVALREFIRKNRGPNGGSGHRHVYFERLGEKALVVGRWPCVDERRADLRQNEKRGDAVS